MRDGKRTNIGNVQRYSTDIGNVQGHRWDYAWYITSVHKIMGKCTDIGECKDIVEYTEMERIIQAMEDGKRTDIGECTDTGKCQYRCTAGGTWKTVKVQTQTNVQI